MKSLRKLFVLAPVMLMSLTACEAKIDEAKAKERVNAYDSAKVEEKYESCDVTMKVDIKKNTGAFAEGGSMYMFVSLMKEMNDDGEQKGQAAEEYVYTSEMFETLMTSFSSVSGETKNAEVTYYSYKSNGLKISGSAKLDQEYQGAKMSGSVKAELYVLDDGRVEKEKATMNLKISGGETDEVKKTNGELNLSLSASVKWNAKK